MNQQPPKKKNGLAIGFVVLIGVFVVAGMLCCGAATFFGISTAASADKTYYAECEYLENSEDCRRCCRDHDHSGNVNGAFLNEGDKTCGCL